MDLIDRAAKHLIATSVEKLRAPSRMPGPLGMANLYVGDGYRGGNSRVDLSNLGLLVKTWGKVVSVDPIKNRFVINDGSYPKESGLVVYAGGMRNGLATWPKEGQYVSITGVSVTMMGNDGACAPGIRVRNSLDVETLKE
jgi:hypothetical protein